MPDSSTPNINFVGGDELLERPGGKIVRWALTTGKAVIVLTELVVVLSFISRFKLDSDIADYNEGIRKKKTIILASSEFESKFREFSNRVAQASTVVNNLPTSTVLEEIKKLIPEGVVISDLTISDGTVTISGASQSEEALAAMSLNFRGSSLFSNTSLDKVTKGENENNSDVKGIGFVIAAKYQKEKKNAVE